MKRALEYFAVLLVVVLVAAVFLPSLLDGPAEPRVSDLDVAMSSFLIAMQSYESQFGRYPSGQNEQILKMLLGDNPRKAPFIALAERSINSRGQFVDPWGTPFQIAMESNLVIRSAGPNKTFGDSDDAVHEDLTRARNKP